LCSIGVSIGHAELLFERNLDGKFYEFHRYETNMDDDKQAVQLLENGSILKSSVTHSYRGILKLNLTDLNSSWTTEEQYSNWLDDNVQEEEQICREGKAFCVQVRETGKQAVAWASYEDDAKIPGGIYIRQMMVAPEFQRLGLGSILLSDVVSVFRPENVGTFLITRKMNTLAISFYEKHGFQKSTYMHDGYDINKYVGLERIR
jgi:ribosomal protein S18 acetylase RimI-like enzyme